MVIGIIGALTLVGLLTTYAYYQIMGNSENKENISLQAGELRLIFSDGSPGFDKELDFGSSAEKTFTILNDGTLDTVAKINWKNLTNTYLAESLTFSLRQTDDEGIETEIITNKSVPKSDTPITTELANGLEIPAKKEYTYTLTINLNYLEFIDQTSDLNAKLETEFNIESGDLSTGLIPKISRSIVRNTSLPEDDTLKVEQPDFSKVAPTPIYKADDFSEGYTYSVSETRYYTYSSDFDFDPETHLYTLKSPEICEYSECFETLKGKYTTSYHGSAYNYLATTTDLSEIYQITESSTDRKVYYTNSSYSIDYYDNSLDGIYSMEDNYGISYYFRGSVENNYVQFGTWSNDESIEESKRGKPMYWRIIRVNGDGSLRIQYDGTQIHKNGENSTDRVIEDIDLNDWYIQEGMDLNDWYIQNIKNNDLDQYISDNNFCNDTRYEERTSSFDEDGYITEKVSYNQIRTFENKSPILTCLKEYADTADDTINGNGKLNEKVGLITVDEAILAGGGGADKDNFDYVNNYKYYLYKGKDYKTFSYFGEYWFMGGLNHGYIFISDTGFLSRFNESIPLAPVINLTPEVTMNLLGTGTETDPYRLK